MREGELRRWGRWRACRVCSTHCERFGTDALCRRSLGRARLHLRGADPARRRDEVGLVQMLELEERPLSPAACTLSGCDSLSRFLSTAKAKGWLLARFMRAPELPARSSHWGCCDARLCCFRFAFALCRCCAPARAQGRRARTLPRLPHSANTATATATVTHHGPGGFTTAGCCITARCHHAPARRSGPALEEALSRRGRSPCPALAKGQGKWESG